MYIVTILSPFAASPTGSPDGSPAGSVLASPARSPAGSRTCRWFTTGWFSLLVQDSLLRWFCGSICTCIMIVVFFATKLKILIIKSDICPPFCVSILLNSLLFFKNFLSFAYSPSLMSIMNKAFQNIMSFCKISHYGHTTLDFILHRPAL